MQTKNYVIAIDSGTQSIRAVLFDRHGTEVAIEQAQYEPYFSLAPGWAEQHTEDYWTKLCQVCRGLMAKINIDKSQISGIGLTSQRNTVIPMDKDGNALRPGIIWLDQRTVTKVPPLSKFINLGMKIAGLLDSIRYAQKNSKFLWILQNEPETYRKTHKFVQVTGFFARKLTGEFRDSTGMVAGIWPFDYKAMRWYGTGFGFIYKAFGIEPRHLVDLYPPDKVLGHITTDASLATGLPEGLPVVVGAGDKQCELLGAGAIDPSIAVISFGTATAMEVITRSYISDPKMRFFTWPAALPKTWDIEMFIYRGFWMVTWYKQEMGLREALEAEKRGVAPEVVLDEVIRDIPPGSMGLMLQPYWSPSVGNKYAKGAIIGFGDIHTRAHIYRAIFEGICFELRRLQEIVQKKTGVPIREIRVGGGGSRSDVAVQIAADMFNLPTSRMATSEISALGAAMDAAVGTGMFASFEEAVAAMVKKGRTFTPNGQNHHIYTELFQDVYKKTFSTMEPIYRRIAQITGYPAED
ncbi:MAG: FGGY-family carbohydrate kinase [Syntrophaceae bacterium]